METVTEPEIEEAEITFEFKSSSTKSAMLIGVCPAWHTGSGQPAWLFADEIAVY